MMMLARQITGLFRAHMNGDTGLVLADGIELAHSCR